MQKLATHLEQEFSHLGELWAVLLEAVEVILGQDEEPLLPPGEELVPLVPQDPLPDDLLGVAAAAILRVAALLKWESSDHQFPLNTDNADPRHGDLAVKCVGNTQTEIISPHDLLSDAG